MLHDEGPCRSVMCFPNVSKASGKVLQRSPQVLYMYVKIMIPPILEILKQTPINIVRKDIIAAIGYLGLCPYDDIVEFIVSKGACGFWSGMRFVLENHTRSPRNARWGFIVTLCATLTIYACHDCLKMNHEKTSRLLTKKHQHHCMGKSTITSTF